MAGRHQEEVEARKHRQKATTIGNESGSVKIH
jgi:hypothetical protein